MFFLFFVFFHKVKIITPPVYFPPECCTTQKEGKTIRRNQKSNEEREGKKRKGRKGKERRKKKWDKSPEQRLNLSRSWHRGHSRAYNTLFLFKSFTKDLSLPIFELIIRYCLSVPKRIVGQICAVPLPYYDLQATELKIANCSMLIHVTSGKH